MAETFRYPFDVQSAMEPWRDKLGPDFDNVINRLSDRDRALEDALAMPWAPYTPTLTQTGTVTNTVTYAKYSRLGRLITVELLLVATGAGTGGSRILVSLPVTAAQGGDMPCGSGYVYDASAALVYAGTATLFTTTTAAIYLGSGVANHLGAAGMIAALANGDNVGLSLVFEAAS